jgi:hypothetical protein
MSLLELLQSVGDRLGIIEKDVSRPVTETRPKIRTRVVTLADLKSEIKTDEVRALAETPAELAVPFEKIFETAGLPSASSGWNIERLGKLLGTAPFRDRPKETVQKMILDILASEKVDVEDLVKDAVSRDQALDAFEKSVEQKMADRIAANEHDLATAKTRMEDLRKECARLENMITADTEQWRQWRRKKRSHEKDLARTVGYLIDREVITTEADDA